MRPKPESSSPAIEVAVRVRDAEYRPLDNANVSLRITLPGGETLPLKAEPDGREAGMLFGDLRHQDAGPLSDLADRDGSRRQHCR